MKKPTDTLSAAEQERWESFRYQRITEPEPGSGRLNLAQYHAQIEQRLGDDTLGTRERKILEELQRWGDALLA